MRKGDLMYNLWNAFVHIDVKTEINKSGGNPYHDPFTGQFTSGPGAGGTSGDADNVVKRANKIGLNGDELEGEATVRIAKKLGWNEDDKGVITCNLEKTIYAQSESEDADIFVLTTYNKTEHKRLMSGKYDTKMQTSPENLGKLGIKISADLRGPSNDEEYYGVVGLSVSKKAHIAERATIKEIRAKLPEKYRKWSDASIASLAGYDAVYVPLAGNGRYDIVNPKIVKVIEDFDYKE